MIVRADTSARWPLADVSVDMIVTSPPYPMLRLYGDDDRELGREDSIEEWVQQQVLVFREARRVLVPHGSMVVNLGDKRPSNGGTSPGAGYRGGKRLAPRPARKGKSASACLGLAGAPWRLALALQGDGWNLISDMIWNPPDASPETLYGWTWERCRQKTKAGALKSHGAQRLNRAGESITFCRRAATTAGWILCPGCEKCDLNGGLVLRRGRWRPTTAHQYLFLFALGPEPHYWDQVATLEEAVGREGATRNARTVQAWKKGHFSGARLGVSGVDGQPVDHHATFSPALPRWAIRGGTPEAGCCSACGAPWVRVVDRERLLDGSPASGSRGDKTRRQVAQGVGNWRRETRFRSRGFLPSCACRAAARPAFVLDPYAGAGTTLLAAEQLGRKAIGLELYLANCRLARRRLQVKLRPQELDSVPRRFAVDGPLFSKAP